MTTVLEASTRRPLDRSPSCAVEAQLRLLIVDDHPAIRRGLRELLEDQPDFSVVAEASSAEEAIAVARNTRFDVGLLDYHLGGRSGLWLSRKLKRLPDAPRVVIYSAYSDGMLAAAAVAAEADGLVSKDQMGSRLAESVRALAGGEPPSIKVPPRLAEVIRHRLDDHEQTIYGMLLAGIPTREIAQTFDTPMSVIDAQLWVMLRKLDPIEASRLSHDPGPEQLLR